MGRTDLLQGGASPTGGETRAKHRKKGNAPPTGIGPYTGCWASHGTGFQNISSGWTFVNRYPVGLPLHTEKQPVP